MALHSGMKLGRRPAVHDKRIPRLSSLIGRPAMLPPVPLTQNWFSEVTNWPMMENQNWGDCAFASIGHMRQSWTQYSCGKQSVMTDQMVLAAYSAVTGFDPDDPNTDQGAVLTDVLAYWMNRGFAVEPGKQERILGYCAVNPSNVMNVARTINIFGSAYVGLNLPIAWQDAEVWDVPPGGKPLRGDWEPGSWGGHCVPLMGYNGTNAGDSITIITWGATKHMTWRAWVAYADECYGVLDRDWLEESGNAPQGFSFEQLEADMSALRRISS